MNQPRNRDAGRPGHPTKFAFKSNDEAGNLALAHIGRAANQLTRVIKLRAATAIAEYYRDNAEQPEVAIFQVTANGHGHQVVSIISSDGDEMFDADRDIDLGRELDRMTEMLPVDRVLEPEVVFDVGPAGVRGKLRATVQILERYPEAERLTVEVFADPDDDTQSYMAPVELYLADGAVIELHEEYDPWTRDLRDALLEVHPSVIAGDDLTIHLQR